MRQIIGLIAEFAKGINSMIRSYSIILQEMELLGALKKDITLLNRGIQQMKNATTIAIAIFSTLLILFVRCCSALADGSPGWACLLSLIRMTE